MNTINLKLEEGVEMPEFKTEGAVGFDLSINKIINIFKGDKAIDADKLKLAQEGFERAGYIKIRPHERILFGTGVFAELPDNIELQIRSRSGVSLKKGLVIANSPGTIDPDYTGELGLIIYNTTPFLSTISKGDRLGQAVPKELTKVELQQVDEITKNTNRGSDGYGSTGTK